MNFRQFMLSSVLGFGGLVLLLLLSNAGRRTRGGTAVAVEAADLLKAYRSSEEKADAQYKKKTLEVTGMVTLNAEGRALELDGGVVAEAADSAEKAFQPIKQGQRVTVRGICGGLRDTGLKGEEQVHLQDCELIKSQPFKHP